ncbi:MAG TPA: hypothetical protein GXZ98_08880 [Firmicutes bacterium]|nr:hypothetical protein [Bacillota bacterium]
MRVKILDQEWELANHPSSIEELFTKIEEQLNGTGKVFSSLIVDGVEIETDFALYLSQRIDEIQEIEVGLKSFRRLMAETMQSAADYLERACPEVEKLSVEFYRGPANESWSKFEQLLQGLKWLFEAVAAIESYHPGLQSSSGWGVELQEKIKLLQEALENTDHVLLGDLLQYEISPSFSALEKEIRELLKNEVCTDDLN